MGIKFSSNLVLTVLLNKKLNEIAAIILLSQNEIAPERGSIIYTWDPNETGIPEIYGSVTAYKYIIGCNTYYVVFLGETVKCFADRKYCSAIYEEESKLFFGEYFNPD